MAMRPWALLLLAMAAAGANSNPTVTSAAEEAAPPKPRPWPEQFHAVLFTNLTARPGDGRLQTVDLYYDWPKRRNLNLIRDQLSDDPLWDVEWTNGTSFYFDSASCRTRHFPVGVLPPDWLVDGSVYLGRARTDGFDCHVWTKVDFVWYYEDVLTHRPVRWNFFNGMQQHVMRFEVGGVLEDAKWQAPPYCFSAPNAGSSDGDERKEGSRLTEAAGHREILKSFIKFAGAATI